MGGGSSSTTRKQNTTVNNTTTNNVASARTGGNAVAVNKGGTANIGLTGVQAANVIRSFSSTVGKLGDAAASIKPGSQSTRPQGRIPSGSGASAPAGGSAPRPVSGTSSGSGHIMMIGAGVSIAALLGYLALKH